MTTKQALAFVRRHGVVLMSARGSVPNLAEAIAGETIRGSWWAHPGSHAIYRITTDVAGSADVLVCRLVNGKITFVHRRLWPALARLSRSLPKERLAAVRNEHTRRGSHRVTCVPFARWLPRAALTAARQLTREEAVEAIGCDLFRRLKG